VTVAGTLADLLTHPWQRLGLRWNWKAATLSTALRGGIFFTTSLTSGVGAAGRALAVDAAFRLPTVGLYAAIVQAFAHAEPLWAATAVVAVGVPIMSHVVEFAVHRAAGTPGLPAAIAVSVTFSVVSSVFQLFVMRHGVLVVGPGARRMVDDLARLPRLVLVFLIAAPRAWRRRASHR
jgi:hypothetical protein